MSRLLFFEEFSGRFFEASRKDIEKAKYELNRKFRVEGAVTLNDLYSELHIPLTDIGDLFGWCMEDGFIFGYEWIDLDFQKVKKCTDDSKTYYSMSYLTEPRPTLAFYEKY